jgi:hypothetical protein
MRLWPMWNNIMKEKKKKHSDAQQAFRVRSRRRNGSWEIPKGKEKNKSLDDSLI